MTYGIYLKEPQASVPASQQKATPLVVIVSHHNRKYKKPLGISIYPRDFVKGKTKDEGINLRLRKIRSYIEERLSDLSSEDAILATLEAVRDIATTGRDGDTIERENNRAKSEIPTFSKYLEEWVTRGGTSSRQRKLFKHNMEKFIGGSIDWGEVDDALHFRLEQKMISAGFSVNYQRKTVGQLKSVMEEGRKLRYHTNLAYKDWKVTKEYPDMIYLTADEVDRVWNVELKSMTERKARDLFIIGVYTVARFSDYSRVSDEIIRDGMIHFIHKKTSTPVCVPVAPRVRAVLDRNGGKAPTLCSQRFNDAIKEVCRKADICEKVERRYSKGAKHITERVPKWSLVTSHTARRTGATLLRQAGASMREIMLIGGWTSEQTLEHYLRMTREENAVKMRDNPFFK